jgi:hypothetical protein
MLFVKAGLLIAGGASLNWPAGCPRRLSQVHPTCGHKGRISPEKVGGAQRVANSIQV